ncbi:hypothetical protein ACH5RR_038516 [Cinchona calisaya]|uniref:Molybdenum cofactor sulfurase n=1 Tax=Cinchona calisaya TaxID=153742 RepID=A0ABD2XW34_9GENT
MQVACIREVSKACSICCSNPCLGQCDQAPNPTPNKSTKTVIPPKQDFLATIFSSIKPNTSFTNHESLPPLPDLYSDLKKAYPQYSDTEFADQIRSQEYYHLSKNVCLDYVGNGLFSYSQKQNQYSGADIASTSSSPPPLQYLNSSEVPFFDISYMSVNLISLLRYGGQKSEFELAMRKRIMKYMNISEDDYSMVFTANQPSAFKLLSDSYPFQTNHKLLTVYDYKNDAIEAMIESSMKNGARPMSAQFTWPSLRINAKRLSKMIIRKGKKKTRRGLVVLPLQSRITGARYAYQWMNKAQENGWHVLLDADALAAKEMETLGLTLFHPDFIVCSFFKVFGENPSGFSCLFVKKSSISDLKKSSTSIGIVSLLPTGKNLFRQSNILGSTESKDQQVTTLEMLLKAEEAGLPTSSSSSSNEETSELQEVQADSLKIQEELSFSEFVKSDGKKVVSDGASSSGIKSSEEIECRGLDHADEVGLILISIRNRFHVNWLVNALLSLQHPHSEEGIPLVKIYGPNISINRGPYVAFNVFDWKGEKIDPFLVQKLADRNNISLVRGFLQNLWFKNHYKEEKEKIYRENGDKFDSGISVVTVSIGFLTNFEDLYNFWAFVSKFLDADFVEKERWRYMALNQTTIEV